MSDTADVIARVTAYGPNVTPGRLEAVCKIFDAIGTGAELFAVGAPAGCAVLLGDIDDVAPLAAPHGSLSFEDRPPFGMSRAPREHVAAKLEQLGRRFDASKVRMGPPEAPPFDGSTLLVVVLPDVIAVTWSQIDPRKFGAWRNA